MLRAKQNEQLRGKAEITALKATMMELPVDLSIFDVAVLGPGDGPLAANHPCL